MRVSKKLFAVIALALLVSVATIGSQHHDPVFDLSNLDQSCQPCADFYEYANGGWLAKNPIPAAYSAWGVGEVLEEKNRTTLREVLEAAAKERNAPKGSNQRRVGDFYAACMAEDKIEAEGLKPLASELERIEKIRDQRGLQEEIAHLHEVGINALFISDSKQDAKNSAEVILEVWQGGLGLPEGEYYFRADDKTVRDEYVKHVGRTFELMGDDGTKAAAAAQTVMRIETKLAASWMPRPERRDPRKVYNRMTLEQLKTFTPSFSWPDYLKNIGVQRKTDINIGQPAFFQSMNEQLTATSIADWKTYLRWRLMDGTAPALSSKFVEEDFNFKGKVLTGTTENLPRWERCVRATDSAMGEALGELYVKKAFPPAAKARALEMVRNLEAALKSNFQTLSWMNDATRKQAIAKLDAFINKIGYPEKWRDYSSLEIDRASYVRNRMRAEVFENRRDLDKIGLPVDRMEWIMTPPTVNAYYSRANNEIVFPAGILQPPYFYPNADDAINYGAMGAVIGHEMSHGFDDQGSRFDAQGNLRNWWTEDDLKNFRERTECIVRQYSAFEVEKDLRVNGQLVAGEAIADLGGLMIAYAAFQKSLEGKQRPANIDGFTPEQRFFLSYARGWATNVRPEQARLQTKNFPHPLPKFRVNGTLANVPAFAAAFSCKAGDRMARSDGERCRIW
jgi:putative endopeptidase